jgi:hypothetical protein
MTDSRPAFELRVFNNGNVILGERLTRSLRAELSEAEDTEVRFAPTTSASSEQAKGVDVGDAALWVFLGTTTRATARVVIEKIKAWSANERNRVVRVTSGDVTIEIPGSPDEAQERIIQQLLENGRS